jgi:hypothetical protein
VKNVGFLAVFALFLRVLDQTHAPIAVRKHGACV